MNSRRSVLAGGPLHQAGHPGCPAPQGTQQQRRQQSWRCLQLQAVQKKQAVSSFTTCMVCVLGTLPAGTTDTTTRITAVATLDSPYF